MISFESHIKDCPPCAGELAELQNVGNLLRMAAAPAPADEWAGLAPGVVGRMCAENHESLRARVGRVFEDMHLVWIALASTTATFLCGAVALGTLQFASPERHDSMAAVIAVHGGALGLRSESGPARWPLPVSERAAGRRRAADAREHARSPTVCPRATRCWPCPRS